MKPGVKIALGIFTSLATIGFIFVYDFYIKDKISSVEVVVVRAGEEINKSETITENKLAIELRPKEVLVDDVVLAEDLESIIGLDAKQEIVGNSMISMKMIDFDEMVPDETKGEAIRPITSDMIYAIPGSVRRKDKIDIYLVYGDGSTNYHQNGPSTLTSETPESENGEIEEGKENGNNDITIKDTKPFLRDVRVVYAKDSGNNEVVSVTEGNNDERLNASSSINHLEVILNEDDFTRLMDEVLQKGARLYVTYQ